MKKENKIIFFSVIAVTLSEIAFYYIVETINSFFENNAFMYRIFPFALFFSFSLFAYGFILPKVLKRFSINTKLLFKVFMIFNIVYNLVCCLGSMAVSLIFMFINPNISSLTSMLDILNYYNIGNDFLGNILYVLLVIAITLIKPILLKRSLEKQWLENRTLNERCDFFYLFKSILLFGFILLLLCANSKAVKQFFSFKVK